jgi:hypothetical protein
MMEGAMSDAECEGSVPGEPRRTADSGQRAEADMCPGGRLLAKTDRETENGRMKAAGNGYNADTTERRTHNPAHI